VRLFKSVGEDALSKFGNVVRQTGRGLDCSLAMSNHYIRHYTRRLKFSVVSTYHISNERPAAYVCPRVTPFVAVGILAPYTPLCKRRPHRPLYSIERSDMLLDATCLALDNDFSIDVNIMALKIHSLIYAGIYQRPL
jgi:hypothetical protein